MKQLDKALKEIGEIMARREEELIIKEFMKQDKYNWEEEFDKIKFHRLIIKDDKQSDIFIEDICCELDKNKIKDLIKDIISNERKRIIDNIIDNIKRSTKLNIKYTKREIMEFISEIKLEGK